jgi:hypothetical protein
MALISLDAATMSTYTVTGESLITTAFDLDTEYSYCVSGDTMSVSLETKGRVGTVMGSVKLQKQ